MQISNFFIFLSYFDISDILNDDVINIKAIGHILSQLRHVRERMLDFDHETGFLSDLVIPDLAHLICLGFNITAYILVTYDVTSLTFREPEKVISDRKFLKKKSVISLCKPITICSLWCVTNLRWTRSANL